MRVSPRNHGRILWVLVTLLFAASLALAGWMVLANWFDATGLTEISAWTPKHIAHDPQEYLRLCQNRLNEAMHLAESTAGELSRRRTQIARAVDDAQPQIRLANQKRLELKAVYEWAQATGRWPVCYANVQFDPQALKASLIGTTRYMQALQGASGQIPQSLTNIDARLKKLQSMGKELDACGAAVRADLAARPPLSQEKLDALCLVGERIEGLRRSLDELARPVEMQLPVDVPVSDVDEAEFAKVLADGQ